MKGKTVPSATNIMVRSVRRPVVRSSTALTTFDPIKNDPGARPTLTFGSATPRAMASTATRNGNVVTATSALRVRTREEATVALPRRDYRRTVYPAGALLGPR